jgi:hypothetical protein
VGSARSAFVISALLCVSNPAFSAELESPTEDSRPSGLLGHTIIRGYAAVVPVNWGNDLTDSPGWGGGFSVSYGIARAVQVSLGFAYHRFNIRGPQTWDVLRHVSTSMELYSPARDVVRPWMGIGIGYYEVEQYSFANAALDLTERRDRNSYVDLKSLGANVGAGVAVRMSERVGLEFGCRYHTTFDHPFVDALELLSVQAGLSYVVR